MLHQTKAKYGGGTPAHSMEAFAIIAIFATRNLTSVSHNLVDECRYASMPLITLQLSMYRHMEEQNRASAAKFPFTS